MYNLSVNQIVNSNQSDLFYLKIYEVLFEGFLYQNHSFLFSMMLEKS